MTFQNVLRQITVVLYRLKRQYGQKLVYYQFVDQTNDTQTGEITRNYNTLTVKRGIILPNRIDRSFVYDLTFIAANNNFVGGGFFDRHQRVIVLDAKDLPKGFKPNNDDHVEFDDDRYEILLITALEKRKGYLLRVQAINSAETVG